MWRKLYCVSQTLLPFSPALLPSATEACNSSYFILYCAQQALLIPYLPSALEALLLVPQADPADVIDVLQLLGQLITR